MALQTVVNDILWNLDIISLVNTNQTLLVDGDKLGFDMRYLQGLRRPLTGDSRNQILAVIQKTLNLCEETLQSYQFVLNSDSQRLFCEKIGSIPDTVWLQNEQIDVINNVYDNLQNFISRKKGVIRGLQNLSTFERYNNDTSFKIDLNRFVQKLEKFIRKCENVRTKMQILYKNTLLENVEKMEINPDLFVRGRPIRDPPSPARSRSPLSRSVASDDEKM